MSQVLLRQEAALGRHAPVRASKQSNLWIIEAPMAIHRLESSSFEPKPSPMTTDARSDSQRKVDESLNVLEATSDRCALFLRGV
jgi:hypothetical protein